MFLRLVLISAASLGLCWSIAASSAAEPPATFEAGEGAYIAGKFDEARAIYAAAATSASETPKGRASSLRQLGLMAWRLDGDNALAERRFNEALSVGADVSRTHADRARFYAAARRFDEAEAAGDAAMATAANIGEQGRAVFAYARAVLERLRGVSIAQQTAGDRKRLLRARDAIGAIAKSPPVPLELSEVWLEVALRLDDGASAFIAWRSYAREGMERGAWVDAGRRLGAALPRWTARNRNQALRNEIVEGFRVSQFYDLAVLIATDERLPDAATFAGIQRNVELIAYTKMLREVRTMTDAYYRDVANRKGDGKQYVTALMGIVQKVWVQLRFDGATPAMTDTAIVAEFDKRFGSVINAGRTGGVQDLHWGHVFLDDARAIEQYGHKASIRLVAVDRLISNGYETWYWDGRQAHGGWASSERIYQIRPGYADSALVQWDLLSDPKRRAEEEERTARLSAADDDLARKDAAAYLPGLAARLDWQGLNAILDNARKQGGNVKQRFAVDFLRIGLDANIFAHEGRHVLDKQAFGKSLDSEELEFRAKLSEIAFSEQPRWSFGPIMNANIDDKSSPHGRANKRVMQGLVSWMDKNRNQVAGLDPARPLLPQFDKLSDEQMRQAMRAMDPWAPKP